MKFNEEKFDKLLAEEHSVREKYISEMYEHLSKAGEVSPLKVDLSMFTSLMMWVDKRNAYSQYQIEQLEKKVRKLTKATKAK